MKLLAGLGNPTGKYEGTRHNMGFEVVDKIAAGLGVSVNKKEHKALVGTAFYEGQKIMLAKPQTYMNLSGESIRALADYYEIALEDILIIVDDVDLEEGMLRARAKGSAGGHNGLKNIILHLGTEEFSRLRVGVGSPEKENMIDHVLGHITGESRKIIDQTIETAAEAALVFVADGIGEVMNKYNGCRRKEENGSTL